MAKKSRKSTKKYRKYLMPGLIVAALLVIGLTALAHNSNSNTPSGGTNPPSTPGNSANSSGSPYSTTPLNPSANSTNDSRKTSPSPKPTLDSTAPSTGSLLVTLTGVNVLGNAVKVSTQVNGASSGTCQVTASLAGHQDVTATSSVVQSDNSYQCHDFGLTTNQFTSGKWHFVVTVSSDGSTASDDNYGNIP